MYIPLLDFRMVTLVENEAKELVAVGISMPSIARALQKAHGKLFPFGWYHLLRALNGKHNEFSTCCSLLCGRTIRGSVNALLFTDLIPIYQKMGFKYAESNPELELNEKVQNQWQYFDHEIHKRRRCFKMNIADK